MKQIIMDVLDDMSDSQINLASETARETVSSLISAALKTKGSYIEFTDYELDEQNARATWVCDICGENTFEVDSDYIGSGTNHLGCELEGSSPEDESRVVDDAGVDIKTGKYVGDNIPEGLKRAKELSQEAIEEGLKKQLSEEIVDNKDKKYIYESPDGGKTIYKRKFGETERELYKEKTDER